MLGRTGVVFIVVASAVTLAACARSQDTPSPRPPPPVPVATSPEEPRPPRPPVKTADDHRREFMIGCARKTINSPDYCECAWGELRKTFTDEELSSGDRPAPKLEKLKEQVFGACASKIPEENMRVEFGKTCIGTKPELEPYCDCTWKELRKRFSSAELGDEATLSSERYFALRAPAVKACASKMPESVSQEAFMKGCVTDPSVDAFCGCAWKELRKQASPAEIESGTFDQKTRVVFAQVDKACGKLRPGKP